MVRVGVSFNIYILLAVVVLHEVFMIKYSIVSI